MDAEEIKEDKKEETKEALSARESFLFGEEKKQREARKKRQRLLEVQSLREGFSFLIRTTVEFVIFVVAGALFIIKGREIQQTDYPLGTTLLVLGVILILKGILSAGGFRLK